MVCPVCSWQTKCTKFLLGVVVHVINTQSICCAEFGPEISADLGEAGNTRT